MKAHLLALVCSGVFLCASSAFAQPGEEPKGDPSPPAPSAQPDPEGEPVQAPPAATKKAPVEEDEAEEAPRPERSPMDEDMDFSPRFRSGFSAIYAGFLPGPVHLFGLEGRAGFQINDLMAVVSSGGALFGFHSDYVSSDKELSFERTFGGFVYGAIMFEVTFLDTLFVGIGPELAWGALIHEEAYGDTTAEEAGGHVSGFYGFIPGFKTRIGAGFGSNEPGRRKQFTFGFDAHVLFGQQYLVGTSAGSSGVTFAAEDGVAVGFMPSAFIGYDAK